MRPMQVGFIGLSQKLLREGRVAREDWLTSKVQEKLSIQDQEKIAAALKLLAELVED